MGSKYFVKNLKIKLTNKFKFKFNLNSILKIDLKI